MVQQTQLPQPPGIIILCLPTYNAHKNSDTAKEKPPQAHFNTSTFKKRFAITATPLRNDKSKKLIDKPLTRPKCGFTTTTTVRASFYGTTNQSKIKFQHNFDIHDSWISLKHEYTKRDQPSWDSLHEMTSDEVAQAATHYIKALVEHIGEHRSSPADDYPNANKIPKFPRSVTAAETAVSSDGLDHIDKVTTVAQTQRDTAQFTVDGLWAMHQ